MKKIFFLCLGIIITISSVGQEVFLDSIPSAITGEESGKLIRAPKRLQTNVSIGTAFTTTSGFGSGFSTYLSPTLSYRVSPRFTVRGGVSVSNTTLFNYQPWYTIEPSQQLNANFTKALIWVQGSYMVTDRLMISGAGYKEFTVTDNSPTYNPYTSNNPYGIYLNATYKINDRMFIQAGFGYRRNQMPFQNDPFFHDPFRW